MAVTLATQVLLDDSRNSIIKVTILGDGATELTKQIIYDSSAYTNDTQNNKLERIIYNLNNFSGFLYWDATTDVLMKSLTPNFSADENFRDIGGLINNGGSGKTGDVLLSTNGLASGPAYTGEIVLYMKKKG